MIKYPMSGKTPKGLLSKAVILLWIVSTIALSERHYGAFGRPERTEASRLPEELFKEQWMGIYQGGEKIGYASSVFRKTDEGYGAYETAFMKIRVMGEEKEVTAELSSMLDTEFRLSFFSFRMKSDMEIEVKGTVEGKRLMMTVDSAGTVSREEIALKEEPYLSISLAPSLVSGGLEVGKRLRLPIVEPSTLSRDFMDVEVVSKETITSMDEKAEAFKIKGSYKGADFLLWATEKGEILREESMGLTFIKERREDALDIVRPTLDLMSHYSVPFDMKLPEKISYLKVRLKGIETAGLDIDGGAQRLTADILEITRADIENLPEEFPPDENHLEGTLLMQSKSPEIVSAAKQIAGAAKDRAGAARLIFEWVHKNIKKVPAMTIPSAAEVLRSRRGDCNEHTALYVALARASGVPSRVAAGLAYRDGFFYYHAWPEVFLGGWVPVDPTLGKYPADPTNIRLIAGGFEEHVRLAQVMGKLRLEGIEFR